MIPMLIKAVISAVLFFAVGVVFCVAGNLWVEWLRDQWRRRKAHRLFARLNYLSATQGTYQGVPFRPLVPGVLGTVYPHMRDSVLFQPFGSPARYVIPAESVKVDNQEALAREAQTARP